MPWRLTRVFGGAALLAATGSAVTLATITSADALVVVTVTGQIVEATQNNPGVSQQYIDFANPGQSAYTATIVVNDALGLSTAPIWPVGLYGGTQFGLPNPVTSFSISVDNGVFATSFDPALYSSAVSYFYNSWAATEYYGFQGPQTSGRRLIPSTSCLKPAMASQFPRVCSPLIPGLPRTRPTSARSISKLGSISRTILTFGER